MKQDIQYLDSNTWAMFMFISLSQQAEGWAWLLKDKVQMRTKQLLNNYLNSTRLLFNHIQGKTDLNDLIEDSAVWSDFMKLMHELPMHKQQALYLAIKELLDGNLTIEDDDAPGTI